MTRCDGRVTAKWTKEHGKPIITTLISIYSYGYTIITESSIFIIIEAYDNS